MEIVGDFKKLDEQLLKPKSKDSKKIVKTEKVEKTNNEKEFEKVLNDLTIIQKSLKELYDKNPNGDLYGAEIFIDQAQKIIKKAIC